MRGNRAQAEVAILLALMIGIILLMTTVLKKRLIPKFEKDVAASVNDNEE